MPNLAAGTRLGQYEIQAPLGAGGMGVVYKAQDTRLKRPVALKLLPPELTRDGPAKQRFLQEAQAASALDHPNICTIYEISETPDGQLYLVMAYYEGETLKEKIERGPLPLDEALDIAIQVGQGLAEAHSAGIVHRDIKPANLLIAKAGVVKILDFGLAKLAGSDSITQTTGTALGTVAYMSPEQARGQKVDQRTDIWSLGVVLYEMVAGHPPFQREQGDAIVYAILREVPTSLTGLRTGVPMDLERVVTRALLKEAEDRYQTAADLLSELRRVTRAVGPTSAADEVAVPSIAVLPFTNMSPDPENEYFSDGITEDIVNALTQLEGLHVAARTSSFSFKGKSPEIAEVGAKLKVETVPEGSVRRAGDRLRVTAQLIKVSNGYHIWSERYDREVRDVFAIQDEIATMIADRLRVTLGDKTREPLIKPPTDNLEAYQLQVKGRALLYQRGLGIPRALECFKRAVALDPKFALAWAGLADAHTALGYYGFLPPGGTMPDAKEAARRATELDPSLAEAHNALAIATLMHDRDWAEAEREFRRSLQLNPGYVQARCWYAVFYLQLVAGRLEEGVAQAQQAVEIDPLSGYTTALHAFTLSIAGRHADAIKQARAAVERDPESYYARWVLQNTYHWDCRFAESVAAGDAALAISGRHSWALASLATTYADWGKSSQVRAVHDELMARTAREYVAPAVLAWSASAAGELDEALALAGRAYQERDPFLLFAKHFPDFARLRSDPRFQDLLRRMNFPH